MTWTCERACGAAGTKAYASPAAARRFAAAFDREDRDKPGRGPPLIGLLPLRAWQTIRRRRGSGQRTGRRP